ncbi:MAG TPA: hypothetical protein PKZ07_17355 [Sedimentisphaerales bacterium]|nr:hypothetical protein [Sedimentisphaerales bacterium]
MNLRTMALLLVTLVVAGCATGKSNPGSRGGAKGAAKSRGNGFRDDVAFLQAYTDVVILKDRSGQGQVVVLPKMQGRVMTSSATGPDGLSFGWINRELIASGEFVKHMNPFGGEDRFWLGPEGGQFSIFFAKGVPFDLEHWFTPAAIDTEPWTLAAKTSRSAVLEKTMKLTNYSGTEFDLRVTRTVRVLDRNMALGLLGTTAGPDVNMVAFESNNKVVNTGLKPWTKDTGLLSIWILGMFNPSPETTVVIPYQTGAESELGPVVNDTYFGKVPEDRLVVKEGVMFFRADGQYRSKIGLTPKRANSVAGSYDALNKVLTIVQYNKPVNAEDYVNSMWQLQEEPFRGDVINSYNDGPASPGAKPMGPFYELETSSPAAALPPGGSIVHIHRTFHFCGPEAQLDAIARATLGTSLEEIKSALP